MFSPKQLRIIADVMEKYYPQVDCSDKTAEELTNLAMKEIWKDVCNLNPKEVKNILRIYFRGYC